MENEGKLESGFNAWDSGNGCEVVIRVLRSSDSDVTLGLSALAKEMEARLGNGLREKASQLKIIVGKTMSSDKLGCTDKAPLMFDESETTFRKLWDKDLLTSIGATFEFLLTHRRTLNKYSEENENGALYAHNGRYGRHAVFSMHDRISVPTRVRLNQHQQSSYNVLRASTFLVRNLIRSLSGRSEIHNLQGGEITCPMYNPGNNPDTAYKWIVSNFGYDLCSACRRKFIDIGKREIISMAIEIWRDFSDRVVAMRKDFKLPLGGA